MTMMHNNSTRSYNRLIIYLYALSIFSYTATRIITTLINWSQSSQVEFNTLFKAFLIGWQFDTVISSYTLILPFLILSIAELFNLNGKPFVRLATSIFLLFFLASICIHVADFAFFPYFFNRMNTTVFVWFNTPKMVIKMLITEPSYLICLITGILLVYIYSKTIFKLTKQFDLPYRRKFIWKIVNILIVLTLLVIGVRGRLKAKSPLREGSAYFSSNVYANKLALNPSFTFLNSLRRDLKRSELKFIDPYKAKSIYNNTFPIIGREIIPTQEVQKKNIIIVIMESMTANNTQLLRAQNESLTPNLDKLMNESISFNHTYTVGVHTFNGIYSTLFSWPTPLNIHPMKISPIPQRQSIGKVLQDHGYQTNYFTTHDDQFDNAGGFLRANGFDKIFHDSLYPSNEIVSTLGVPDHFLFKFAIEELNKQSKNNRPFFAALMTGSNHNPWIIPKGIDFKPRTGELKDQIVEYADWSIGQFIKEAKQMPWYENTLFVFIADHGLTRDPIYEMPLSYHHTPFIIHTTSIEAKSYDSLASQMDVFPTLMGMLNLKWKNETMGIDLFNETREFVPINSDDKSGLLSKEHFYVKRASGEQAIYYYSNKDLKNYVNEKNEMAVEYGQITDSIMQLSLEAYE